MGEGADLPHATLMSRQANHLLFAWAAVAIEDGRKDRVEAVVDIQVFSVDLQNFV